jgi:hypothetical protein
MNERIRELAKQAGIVIPKDSEYNGHIYRNAIEKFAQLIVDECASLYTHDDVTAPVGQSAWGEAYQDGWIEGTKAYRETILEHFGVES